MAEGHQHRQLGPRRPEIPGIGRVRTVRSPRVQVPKWAYNLRVYVHIHTYIRKYIHTSAYKSHIYICIYIYTHTIELMIWLEPSTPSLGKWAPLGTSTAGPAASGHAGLFGPWFGCSIGLGVYKLDLPSRSTMWSLGPYQESN